MQVKTDAANKWTTEWTSRPIGDGMKLGAVPDFLPELQNEYHGPAFDNYALVDNSHEKGDESQYHYKTPLDVHDFLSHHQEPNSIEWSEEHEWWVPHNKLLEIQKDEADRQLANQLPAQNKTPLKIKWNKKPEQPPTEAPDQQNTKNKTKNVDTKIKNLMKTNKTNQKKKSRLSHTNEIHGQSKKEDKHDTNQIKRNLKKKTLQHKISDKNFQRNPSVTNSESSAHNGQTRHVSWENHKNTCLRSSEYATTEAGETGSN